MIQISSDTQQQFSDGQQDQNVQEVSIHNQKSTVRVLFHKQQDQIQFIVDQYDTLDVYATSFKGQNVHPSLSFYEDAKTVFKYLALNLQQRIQYNHQGHYLLLIDKIVIGKQAKQVKIFKIPLQRKELDALEIKDLKIKRLEAQNKKLRWQKGQLKYNTDEWNRQKSKFKQTIKEMKEQKNIMIERIKVLEHKSRIWKQQQQALHQRCRMFNTNFDQEVEYLERRIKMRKLNEGNIVERNILNQSLLNKTDQLVQTKDSINGTFLKNNSFSFNQPIRQQCQISKQDGQIFQIQADHTLILQKILKFTIPLQPNSSLFAVDLPTIKKVSCSDSRMFYFISDQCAKQSLHRDSRVYMTIQNVSNEEQLDSQPFKMSVGIISSSQVSKKSVYDCEKAIYLKTHESQIINLGQKHSLGSKQIADYYSIIKVVLDFDEQLIEWYDNNFLLKKLPLNVEIWQSGNKQSS